MVKKLICQKILFFVHYGVIFLLLLEIRELFSGFAGHVSSNLFNYTQSGFAGHASLDLFFYTPFESEYKNRSKET